MASRTAAVLRLALAIFAASALLLSSAPASADVPTAPGAVVITGNVRNPSTLTLDDERPLGQSRLAVSGDAEGARYVSDLTELRIVEMAGR